MLQIKEIKVAYKSITVLNDVSLDVADDTITVLIGANGVGKTTLMNAIMGIHKPYAGQILYGDIDLMRVKPYQITGLGISICPEGRQLFPDMTVIENMEIGAYSRKDAKETKEDIESLLEKFPILAQRRHQKAKTLSGGEQEILAIARALVINPRFLLLDEPSWGLAPLMIEEVMQTIQSIKEQMDTTVLLVEQNANIALKYADYAYLMSTGGEIVIQGTGKELLANEKVVEVYLGGV